MRIARSGPAREPRTVPRFEIRALRRPAGLVLEIWQLPSLASPGLREPRYVGGLSGRNLALIEHRVLRQLRPVGIELPELRGGDQTRRELEEDLALRLGLTFRALAPMRSRTHMRACIEGIDKMGREEAAYWLGMTMHRRRPRRVLQALRILLTDPNRSG